MATPLTFRNRLPGVVCASTLPPRDEPLRLDVAAFVGFAERGPLDLPVAVEDMSQYNAVFGGDFLIARTRLGGQPVYAALPQAVKAFFDNGGRRCYVVRVAGDNARPNRFSVPGLLTWQTNDPKGDALKPTITPAAWVGRWSDDMSIGTQLRSQSLLLGSSSVNWANGPSISLELPTLESLQSGDLLRLQFDGSDKPILFFSVASVESGGKSTILARGVSVTVKANPATLIAFSYNSQDTQLEPVSTQILKENGWEDLPCVSAGQLEQQADGQYQYTVQLSSQKQTSVNSYAIATTDLLRIKCKNGRTLWFPVKTVVPLHLPGQASAQSQPNTWQLTSQDALWDFLATPPSSTGEQVAPSGMIPGTLQQVDLLSFDLLVHEGHKIEEVWRTLSFGQGPNYWVNTLAPSLDDLQQEASQTGGSLHDLPGQDPTRSPRLGAPLLTDDATSVSPRFYLPFGMDNLLDTENFAKALPDVTSDTNSLQTLSSKDGLEEFDPVQLFLDPNLANIGMRDLLNEANALLYQQQHPVALKKLHSLLMIDEIGMISIPDLVQRPWSSQIFIPQPPPLKIVPPSPPPDWSHFQDCSQPTIEQTQSTLPDDATTLTSSPDDTAPTSSSDDIEQLDARQPLRFLPVLDTIDTYNERVLNKLLDVQHALLNLCAARADVLAVYSLPLHFKRREVLEWQGSFMSLVGNSDDPIFSYVAVYHPWLQIPEPTTPELTPLRAVPPNGTICGMIAARELARGPWIAPANVPLKGVIGLMPALNDAEWLDLFNAQINLVRQPPGQITLLSARTLSSDDQLQQISVRRLLIFLRKLALRRGMRYVFEPNNEKFRQRVQNSFEQMLTTLVERGGITAFEVVTDATINTPNDYENGRFLIELKVAPTLPIEFITIVLLRAGEDLLDVIER